MTLNATNSILYRAVETGRLVARPALNQKVEAKRFLYVTPNVYRGLAGKDPDLSHLPMAKMEELIAIFCFGWFVTASLKGDPDERGPDIERLHSVDEVWVICARKPRHVQVRLFGRFLDAGVFIGLGLHCRHWLGIKKNYSETVAGIPDLWGNTMGNAQPFRAATALEHVKGICRDVDEKI
ncbi:hypothetical protein NKH63_01355 [Mesorhizobium sp. M0960]|uniref:hypothetical protein n=2 Tax=unclassified Mesorhizobium TaxID=325217 RepID=UPI00333DE1DA